MKAGIVKISPELIVDGHKFPETWSLIDIRMDHFANQVEAIFSGPGFEEVPEGSIYPDYKVTIQDGNHIVEKVGYTYPDIHVSAKEIIANFARTVTKNAQKNYGMIEKIRKESEKEQP